MREETAHLDMELLGRRNRPLDFTLKSIDLEHSMLETLGISQETRHTFGVGYFTGKGIMHEKVVMPFHNADGLLVAYVGYSPKDDALTYPGRKHFDRRLELFNVPRTEKAGWYMDDVVLVKDLWTVLRFYDLGLARVVALPTEHLHPPQIRLLERLVGLGGRVHFVPWVRKYDENLERLAEHFHVRLHRHHHDSDHEFLSSVAARAAQW